MIHQARFIDWFWVMPATAGIAAFCGLMLWVALLPKNRPKSGEVAPFFRTAFAAALATLGAELVATGAGLLDQRVAAILSVFGLHVLIVAGLLTVFAGLIAVSTYILVTRSRDLSTIVGIGIVLAVICVLGGLLMVFALDAGLAVAAGQKTVTGLATAKSAKPCGRNSTCYEATIGSVRLALQRVTYQQLQPGRCYETVYFQGPFWTAQKTSHILSIRSLPASSC